MKIKKLLVLLLSGMMVLSFAACGGGGGEEEAPAPEEGATLMMATTTSTEDTGLLDYLQPLFKEATGIDLQWTAVGTGEALKMGEDGQVDIVLVHAKASEEEFVANGFGVERFPVMYNDFVIVGPKDKLMETEDVASVFGAINAQELPFVSRGDDSGTDKKEKKIWEALEIDPVRIHLRHTLRSASELHRM